MAGRGPAPKATRSRKRDQPNRVELVVNDENLFGPPLPEGVLGEDETWHPQTVALWDSLRRFPLLADEPDLGWQFLLDTALMHHTMWTRGRWEFASEVRLRVAKYGATPEDRLRLKVKITSPTVEAPPAATSPAAGGGGDVTDMTSRRKRLA